VDLSGKHRAACRRLPVRTAAAGMGQLLAADRGARPLLAAPGPPAGGELWPHDVFDPETGRRLLAIPDRPRGGYSWRDGTAVVLSADARDSSPALFWIAEDGPGEPLRVPSPSGATQMLAGPQLCFDELVWAAAPEQGAPQLFTLRLDPQQTELGAPLRVGPTGPLGADLALEACRTESMLAVLARGRAEGYSTRVALAFRDERGWSEPEQATVPSDWFGLTCHARTASLSWIDAQHEQRLDPGTRPGSPVRGTYRVHRIRCHAGGCRHQHAELELTRHSRASRYVVGDLGEAVMVLWRSPLGDVRARVAPLDRLAEAPDAALFDDEQHGGFAWELGRGAVFARQRSAVVVLKAPRGDGFALFGLRIDHDGSAEPVEVE
jgi:hypothetical protein